MNIRTLLPLATLAFATAVQAAPASQSGDLPAHGQHQRGHDCHKAGGWPERFDRHADLGLSEAQKQKLEGLRDEARAKHEAIRRDYQRRFDAVLTQEQRARLAAGRELARRQHAEHLERRAEQLQARAQSLRAVQPLTEAR